MAGMARPATMTQAQRDRDAGLARSRRITWYAAIGAAGVTAAAAAIAANTIPGHALDQQAASSASSAASASGAASSGDTSSNGVYDPWAGSQPPPQQAPVVVSGSS